MDELMYDTLVNYFKALAHTGYKSYDTVFKMLVIDFIYEITHTELRYYITNKDIKLMQDLLYQLFGSTCEISFPTNNRPCCVCVCCNGGGHKPPPVIPDTPTTTTTTPPPIEPTYLILNSTVAETAYVDYELVNMWTPIKVEAGSRVIIIAQNVSGYTFSGFYVAGSLISSNNIFQYIIPSTGTNTIELRYEKDGEIPIRTSTIVFKHDSRTAYTVTYNGNGSLNVSNLEDKEIRLSFPVGATEGASLQFIINNIVCTNSNYECNSIGQGELPYSFSVTANQRIVVTPVITAPSVPPVTGNNIYYGVVSEYMAPSDFVNLSINTLMRRSSTKSKTVTGTGVNEFTIPQNGYYAYLIVPVDKVELQYAAFTSSGITTVYYDSTKENIPGDTNNGAFYSKYTRGGVNANQGGVYNGVNYDVYFAYLASGGATELINVKAKNK